MKPKLLKSLLGKKKELDKYRPLDKAIVDKLREQFSVGMDIQFQCH
jgi:hypothetical protein